MKFNKAQLLKKLDVSSAMANPILDIAARFWDIDRYDAFRICYKSMRFLDDLVDDFKISDYRNSTDKRMQIDQQLTDWLTNFQNHTPIDNNQKQLLDTIDQFAIPQWPWERLVRSMKYDLHNDGYKSLLDFLRYCEGAAISPAAVFMHLCGVKNEGHTYTAPSYNIRTAARPLALFAYFVHIIRDFQKDTQEGLCYIPDSMLKDHELDINDLHHVANGGTINRAFRNLMGIYKSIAGYFHRQVAFTSKKIYPHMHPEYQFSLELIFQLYSQIFEKIDHINGHFTKYELHPTPDEIIGRVKSAALNFQVVQVKS